ncbi:amino acid adenylation domain-containing protein [Streptomyces sp. NPDC002328]|uniref:amino acid adenylation domain-containing protein n=1 Tax=Streptomyces sp. NPDC002328 TaxID=3364642 RepID=UPI0036BFAD93
MSENTLWSVLLSAALEAPDQIVVHVHGDGSEVRVTHRQLLRAARQVAGGLRAAGVRPGTCVPLVADRSEDFQPMFWGLMAAGLVPVPLAADARRVLPVWEHLGRPPVFVDAACEALTRQLPSEAVVLRLDDLRDSPEATELPACGPDDLAFVQFSSGSTGVPKGVELTHAAVTANLGQIVAASRLTDRSVMVSWMPYFHDMGLIGTHLAPLAARAKQVKTGPLAFARRPAVWFETATAHRATHLSAANFALALAARRISEEEMARFDLSSVRMVVVGAEPISASVWRDFARLTRPAGLPPQALQPVYGLAEATLAVTFPPPGEIAVPVTVDRVALSRGQVVDVSAAGVTAGLSAGVTAGAATVEIMDTGRPVPGCSVRIVDDSGRLLGDRRVGHIEVRGPQLARGYHALPDATADAFVDGWLRTGDLGFLRDGRLCVSGRHKDVLFLNGLKHHAADLEDVAATTPGLPSGVTAAVVGSTDPATGGERVVVFVSWARPPRTAAEVLERVAARVGEALFHDDVRVVALPPGGFPRTTSGKLRRHVLRERFEEGRYQRVVVRRVGGEGVAPLEGPSGVGPGGGSGDPRVADPRPSGPRSRAEAERGVRAVWARVLGLPESGFGVRDSFRALGGTSLKAMQVLAELEDAFGVPLETAALRAGEDTVAALVDELLAGEVVGGGGVEGRTGGGAEGGARDGRGAGADADAGVGVSAGAGVGASAGVEADAIAVVGLACRFPGADSPEAYWRLLVEGRDAVTPVPPHRRSTWDDEPDKAQAGEARWGAFLKDPAAFDADRFGIGDAEARTLDPQARLLLELAHEALERAGYAGPRRRAHRIGVYTTGGDSGYREILARASAHDGVGMPPSALTGNLPNLLAARIAQTFDLDGPALVVDTACSSALVALHLARRALAAGECDIALVGGVNLHLTATAHRMLHAAQALSPTGRSRAFAADADGFVPGEGGAMLVLRRAEDARRADDDVLALVRGTAVNNDGTSLSLLAPNPARQREVITAAYAAAGIDPAQVTYVEAHGTGTAIGDPVELKSLAHAFPPRADGRPRLLGSAKTNIGHLLNAAGLPSLVKVVLALRHGQVPPSLHASRPSPATARSGFEVPGELVAWPAPAEPGPRLAGVNAFGFGGTNAHAVLEQAPAVGEQASAGREQAPAERPLDAGVLAGEESGPHLLALSAATAPALRAVVRGLSAHLDAHPRLTEPDVCLTAGTARDDDRHRLALVCDGDLRERLSVLAASAAADGTRQLPADKDTFTGTVAARPRLAFLFPGQGAQRPGMAAELYATAPVFRDTLDEASDILGPLYGRTLTDWSTDARLDPAEQARTEIAQPVLVAFGVALARQLGAWGVVPDAVAGHSVGELAAACAAGLLSLPDAVRFAAERGRLMAESTEPGAMAAVRGGEDVVDALVAASDGALAVAARNAPGRLVLSGTRGAVEHAMAELTVRGVAVRGLRVSRAFHSPLMEPVADALYAAGDALSPVASRIPLLSTLTADWQPRPDAAHWREHALRPVLFGAAAQRLVEDGYDTFVEIGPGTDLPAALREAASAASMASEASAAAGHAGRGGPVTDHLRPLTTLSALPPAAGSSATSAASAFAGDASSSAGGSAALLRTVGRLWVHGVAVDHAATAPTGRRVPLPTYPFQRRSSWPGPDVTRLLHRVAWTPAPLPAADGYPETLVTGPDADAVREFGFRLAARGVPVLYAGADRAHTVVHLAHGKSTDTSSASAHFRGALREFDRAGARRLLLLTEDAHHTGTGDGERPRPEQALLTGLALALPEETPGATLICADLSSQETQDQRLAAVLAELTAAADQDPSAVVVAWRAGVRLARTIQPLPTSFVPVPVDVIDPLPADGVYLITGGAGGVGAALARDLAGRGRPTLVLTGRSAPPPTALLAELTDLGAKVRYLPADVTDERQLDALLAEMPAPDVVVHAAGVVVPGSLRAADPRDSERALAAKTHGSRLLSRALRRHGHRPRLCVALSSVASVLPGAAGALGDYAAANAYLDAFAAAERAEGRTWLALNLAAVARTGLAAAFDGHTPVRVGGTPLSVADALAALRAACAVTDTAQLVVADLTSPEPKPHTSTPTPVSARPLVSPPKQTEPAALAPRRDGTPHSPGETPDTRTLVRNLLADALHLTPDAVDENRAFLALGLDSLAAVDLVKRLERALGRDLPTTLFFEYQTVRELAAHLDSPPTADDAPPVDTVTLPASENTPFPLTPVQLALHTSSLLYPDTPARGWVRQTVRGPLDEDVLRRALTALAERHGMLRIRIRTRARTTHDGHETHQVVTPATAQETWFETRPCPGGGESLEALEAELANRPLDLTAEPPLRALLAVEHAELAHLVLAVHHAAADGYSLNVLCTELWTLYTDLALGRTPEPLPPTTDFAAYVAQATPTAQPPHPAHADDTAYWTARLADRPPLPLPYDDDLDAEQGPGPLAALNGALDADLVAALRDRAARWNVSLFHLLLAAYVRCLARWTGHEDVTVNVARAGRDARIPGLDRLVGPLADTLPLLCAAAPDEPLADLAERVRRAWLESERHATVSSLDLARLLPGDASGPRTASPASFSFARFPAPLDPDCPVTVRATAAGTGSSATRLSLLCWEDGPLLRLSWNVPERLLTRATVTRLAADYRRELHDATTVPTTSPGGSAKATVVGRVLDRFRAAPEAVAVDDGRTTLTYRELDTASHALARRLRARGVRHGDLVGLLTSPGPDTVVAVVGILRAGAGWVPLDAEYPTARLTEQTARCEARVVVHDDRTRPAAEALAAVTPVSVADETDHAETGIDTGTWTVDADADATAYVIFTSGSTGRPKAVPITFRAMENYLDWAVDTFGYGPGDRLANTASPCFDASVRQLLAPLLTGATVVTADRDLVRDPELLLRHVERARITVWSSVPSLWERMLTAAEDIVRRGEPLPDLSALRWVHVGGEALWADRVRRWFDLFGDGRRIVNLYGPTESTINATYHIVDERPADDATALPIGRAVAGAELLVVGPDGEPLGPGGTGELLIGGVGLTAGYLGEPELTRAAFVSRDGRRLYRSGDRVHVLPDGALRFVGRLDDQVKIRGHRVEPGEVEAVLRAHPDVAQAVVLADEDRLLAFVTRTNASTESVASAAGPDAVQLRRHLAATLPPYMLPARITLVDALPLTGTGKVDRRALLHRTTTPAVVAAPTTMPTVSPVPTTMSVTEERLGRIWCEVLGVDEVQRHDDFFDLGGDSLLALQVFDRLARHGRPLPRPTAVYRHRTLAALAGAVDAADMSGTGGNLGVETEAEAGTETEAGTEVEAIEPAQADGTSPAPYPVTPSQRGFLLAEALAPGTGGSWLTRLRLNGPLDRDRFQAAVDVLVVRHPMLRTVFPAGARPPVQQELPVSLRLPVDFETVSGPEELDERIETERRRRFEPWAWPLLRLRVLTLTPGEHILVAHAHHLIGDGYSAALLLKELTSVYDELGRGESPAQSGPRGTFREHALRLAQQALRAEPTTDEERRRRAALSAPYAKPVLRAGTPTAPAPTAPAHGDPRPGSFRTHGFVLDAPTVRALRKIAADAGGTLYAPLLAAYHRELGSLTGRQDLVIGLAVSGRDHPLPDIHRVFGPFATAVAVRPPAPEVGALTPEVDAFAEHVRRIVEETIAARTHEDVVPRDAGGLPLTSQFFFTFLDFTALGPLSGDSGNLTFSQEGLEGSEFTPPPSGTDVFLAARPEADRLRITVRGAATAFDVSSLAAFADALRDRLTAAVGPRPARRTARLHAGEADRAEPGGRELDAALVGYLPAPAHLARLVGAPMAESTREDVRRLLFPSGGPRLLETTSTPLGRSGFVAVPLFADELATHGTLVGHTVRAVEAAAALGARCVSLAGMIPSLTGYGFDVLRASQAASHASHASLASHASVEVTTGHAATVVSVVRTVHAALEAAGRDLADAELAVVGLGSIGASALELLLTLAERPPARLLLCDVPGSGPRLSDLADRLRARGPAGRTAVHACDPALPDAVYEADLIVAAVSGGGTVLDVDRLRPGTIVVDDSFPHCFDTARALARMREREDVLVVGGGLLSIGATRRTLADGLPSVVASADGAAQHWLEGTLASCRAESLLYASGADVPLVRGLVDAPTALAYWRAVERTGAAAAPLHLLGEVLAPGLPAALRRHQYRRR